MTNDAQLSKTGERKLIKVGDYRLVVQTAGTGTPPVVIVPGVDDAFMEWEKVVPKVAKNTTCFTYARPGLEGSDDLSEADLAIPRPASWVAEQFYELISKTDIETPFVLVGHSFGAYVIDYFVAKWPELVSALVFVEPSTFEGFPAPQKNSLIWEDGEGYTLRMDVPTTREELNQRDISHLGRIPTVVLSRAIGHTLTIKSDFFTIPLSQIDDFWHENQRRWVKRWSATQIIAKEGGHEINIDQPDLTAFVINETARFIREGTQVNFDPEAVSAAGGNLVPTIAIDN